MIIICVSQFNVQTPLTNKHKHTPASSKIYYETSDAQEQGCLQQVKKSAISTNLSTLQSTEGRRTVKTATQLDCWLTVGFWSCPELQSAWREAQKTFTTSTGIYTHLPSPFPLCLVNEHTPPSSCLKLTWQLACCVCTQKTDPPPSPAVAGARVSVNVRQRERD